jgi:hypothetical protein
MGNLLKKVTSTVSVLAIAASAMGATASVSAASEFLAYADMLAADGVINSTTEANYRLGDNITRAEVAKIAVKLSGLEMYDCVGDVFSDVGPSLGDLCSAIETAAAEGFVNANADTFRPTDKVTRAEMVKMLLAANGVEPSDTTANFKDIATIGDLAGYINAGVEIGAIKDGEYFRPNANATRGEAFKVASVVMDSVEPTTPPTNGTGTTTTPPTTSTGTTSTGVVTAGGLTISNDASGMQYTPKLGTIKAGKYSFAAASSDVTLKSLKMKRGGLGQRDGIDSVWFEYNGKRVTTQASVNSDETITLSFTPAWKIMAGTTGTLDLIVKLRAPGVSGAQHNFAIVMANDVMSTASTLTATFPLVSNTIVTTDYSAVTATFESVAATPKTVKTGEKDVVLGEFRVQTTGSRDVILKNVTFYNEGDLDTKYLANLAIYSKTTGAKVSSSMVVDGRNITFMLNDTIAYTNSSRNYQVKGDILAIEKTSESLQFTFDGRSENLIAEEIASGYRVATTLGTNALYDITVEAGSLSLTDKGNTANVDVAAGQNDIVLARGTLTAKEGAKLRDLTLSFNNIDELVVAKLSQVRVNVGGQSISVDGSSFKEANAGGGADKPAYTINNTFVVDTGVSDFTITADVRADATATTFQLNDVSLATAFNDIRYTSSDRQVTDASGRVTGIKNTVKSSTVSISNNSAAATNVVGGAKNLSLLKYTLNNNNVSDITITGESYLATLDLTSAANRDKLKDLTVALYINGTEIASKNATSFTVVDADTATVALDFSSSTFKVEKNKSATLELKTTALPRFAEGEKFNVARTTPATNVSDTNGNAVTVSNGSVAGYGLTIANPKLDIALASDDASEIVLANAGLVELAKVRVRATNDDLSIKELYLSLKQDAVISDASVARVARLVNEVQLVDSTGKVLGLGTVLVKEIAGVDNDVAFVKFNSVDGATVARNTDMILTVKASVGALAEAADSGLKIVVGLGAGAATTDADVDTAADYAVVAEGSTQTLDSTSLAGDVVLTAPTASKADLITSGKLVAAANSISNASAGQVKYTLTNNGSDAVLVKSLSLSSGNATRVKLYKGDVANASERLEADADGNGSAIGAVILDGVSTLEIQAGQTVTILADFYSDGTGLSAGDNTINVSLDDVSYEDKVQGAYTGAPIASISSYKGTGLPASTSFKVSGTAGY